MVQFLGVAVERYTLDLADSGYVRLAYVRIVLSWYRECVSHGLEFAASDYVGVKPPGEKKRQRSCRVPESFKRSGGVSVS